MIWELLNYKYKSYNVSEFRPLTSIKRTHASGSVDNGEVGAVVVDEVLSVEHQVEVPGVVAFVCGCFEEFHVEVGRINWSLLNNKVGSQREMCNSLWVVEVNHLINGEIVMFYD